MKLYNTFSRKVEDFTSIEEGKVKIYCCGPTVYDYQHIGNFKTFLCEDILIRTLKFAGYDLTHVMNITDVGHLVSDADDGEDKMLIAARREKKKSHEIAERYTSKFFEDWDKLNLLRPDITCKATEHIQEMIDLIKRLEEKDIAYFSNGNVYFDVSKFEEYGKLALLDLEKLQAGARIEVDPAKRNPHDFVMWFTRSKFENHELLWDSPWGMGYPGWHIECTAMSIKYLGEHFDIHCGGIDHIPVHHTNEIAQAEAATEKKWVNFWFHSEFMLLNNEKMSKSKGGFLVLDDLIESGYSPETFRMLILGTHYRKQVNFSEDSLDNAQRNVDKLKAAYLNCKASAQDEGQVLDSYLKEFSQALFNDLNSPQALANVWKLLGDEEVSSEDKLATLYKIDEAFGFNMTNWQEEKLEIPADVQNLLEQRQVARDEKNWSLSDQLRDQIKELGYLVIDDAKNQTVKRI